MNRKYLILLIVVMATSIIALKVIPENKSQESENVDEIEINKNISDVLLIEEKIILGQSSVEIMKMVYSKETVDVYFKLNYSDDSFISYFSLILHNDEGKRYFPVTETINRGTNVNIQTYKIDKAFINSEKIKFVAHQANVCNIRETISFNTGGNNFEYDGYQYTLNLSDPESIFKTFELVCESDDVSSYPEISFKSSSYGWFKMYQNDLNPPLLNAVDQAMMTLDKIIEIGISSPDDISVITESIEVDLTK